MCDDNNLQIILLWKLPAHSDVEMFEILPMDRNLKPIFAKKRSYVDMNWGWGFNDPLTPRQFQPWSTFGPQARHADFHCPTVPWPLPPRCPPQLHIPGAAHDEQ